MREAVGRSAEGEHRIRVENPDGFVTSSVVLTPSAPAEEARADRPPVLAWSPTHREVEVSVSSESVVGVAESANPGWTATVDGTELRSVVLDGWRQGFVVPAGTEGVVAMDYAPQTPFRLAPVGGLAVVGLLLLLALGLIVLGFGRRGRNPPGAVGRVVLGVPPATGCRSPRSSCWASCRCPRRGHAGRLGHP